MAIIEFRCQHCGFTEEKISRFLDEPPNCYQCGNRMVKQLSVPSPAQWSCSKGSL